MSAISMLAVRMSLGLLASMISFGALVAFSVVNLAVIKHYLVDHRGRTGHDVLLHGLCPLVGCLLSAWLWTSLSQESLTMGLRWLAVGATYLAILTRGLTRTPPAMTMSESATA